MEILLHRIASDPYKILSEDYSDVVDFGSFELDMRSGATVIVLKTPGEPKFSKSLDPAEHAVLRAKFTQRAALERDILAQVKLEKWITDNAI